MYTIHATFQRLREVNLCELLGAIGVYVIWDAQAKARPTYIGEGNVLKRFTNHVERDGRVFARLWDGYLTLISGSTRNVHKEESRAVERLLLDVAQIIDRRPRVNVHSGAASAVMTFCRDETLRVAISGYDPFTPPDRALLVRREIKARFNAENALYTFEHNWRLRRLGLPVVRSRLWA